MARPQASESPPPCFGADRSARRASPPAADIAQVAECGEGMAMTETAAFGGAGGAGGAGAAGGPAVPAHEYPLTGLVTARDGKDRSPPVAETHAGGKRPPTLLPLLML